MTTEVTGAPAPAPAGAPAAPAPAPTPEQIAGSPAPAPAPTEAPAPAPAAKLELDDPDAEAAKANEPGPEPIVYNETGDPALDLALDFVGARGFGPDHPAMKAAEKGDFAPLRRALAAMGDKAKGYERFLALGEKAFKESAAKAETANAQLQETIHKAVGGQEEWEAVRAWASGAASPEEKASINAALKLGGPAAVAMAKELAGLYRANPKSTQNPAATTNPNASGKAASQGPLTAAQYASEAAALRAKIGYGFDSSPEYAALQGRRLAAMKAGVR